MNEEGFTLLEVLVAIVILVVSLSVLIDIQSNYIKRTEEDLIKLQAINFFKKHYYGIKPEGDFSIKVEKESLPFGVYEIKNKIYDKKTEKEILEIITYEK